MSATADNTAGLVPVGPWYVEARLLDALGTGRPYLSAELSEGFVAEKWKRWQGGEKEARELAKEFGGAAVPKGWVRAERPTSNVQRPTPNEDAIHRVNAELQTLRRHRCDRTGEVIS